MNSFEGIRRPSYSTERFIHDPEVIATRAMIDDGITQFVHDLQKHISPAINQAILFEALPTGPITPLRNPRLHEVGGAIAGAAIDNDAELATYNEVIGSTIPLRGTALETQLSRVKKGTKTTSGLSAASALNANHIVLGFPVDTTEGKTIGMAQVATSREVAQELGQRSPRYANYTSLARARALWQDYKEPIGEQITELHTLHKQLRHDEPYFESLELATPKVAPNSIALTFDLVNSTERALAQHDGAFTHFLNTWKRNVSKIIEFHELTKTTELIGDLGDGYSVIFWLGRDVDVYDEQEVEAFRDLVVVPFTKTVQAMSEELAAAYSSDLGPLTFNTSETETFSYVHSPTDISARGLWMNARKLK